MKHLYPLLLIVLTVSLSGQDEALTTSRYLISQATLFKMLERDISLKTDPFEKKEKTKEENLTADYPEADYIAQALDIEITETNGKFLTFDGEVLYARLAESEHKKIAAAMVKAGIRPSCKSDAKFVESPEYERERPKKTE